MFTTTAGTTSCGGAALSPPAQAPFTGALFNATTGGTKLSDLGSSCLYVGGGGNTATAPNSNPDGAPTRFCVSATNGDTLTLAATAGTGPASCTLGPAATKHCTRTPNTACTIDDDCGGSGLCNFDPQCYFGPPLPIPAGPTSTCVMNVFRQDATGTVNKALGTSNISLPLASYVYLVGAPRACTNFAPGSDGNGTCSNDAGCGGTAGTCQLAPTCPKCLPSATSSTGNRCLTGKRHNQECTPVGSKLTTLDCPPKDSIFIAPLNVTLSPLGTDPTTLRADGTGKFCGASQRTIGAFGKTAARRIEETGSVAGPLTDGAAHAVTIAATFCIPATGNALIDGGTGADLPGPGAVSLRGTFQTN